MLEQFLPKLDFLTSKTNNKGLLTRFKEAFEKAKASKDKGFIEKVGIFFSSFFEETEKVEKKKEEVTAETTAVVQGGIDETMKSAKDAAGLKPEVASEDRQFYDEILAMGVTSFKGMDTDHQASAHSALQKIDKTAKGAAVEAFSFEESSALLGVGLKTLKQLKNRFPNRQDFSTALERMATLSDSSNYPLKKLFSTDTLKLFSISDESEGLKFLAAFDIHPSMGDLLGKGEATKVKELMTGLGHSPIQNKDGIVNFMKEHIFPNTEKSAIITVVGILNGMITGGSDQINTDQLAELAFNIHDEDYDHLITALVGKKNSTVAELADAS